MHMSNELSQKYTVKTNSPICAAGSQDDTLAVSLTSRHGNVNTSCSWLPLEALYSAAMCKSIHCQGGNNYSIEVRMAITAQ